MLVRPFATALAVLVLASLTLGALPASLSAQAGDGDREWLPPGADSAVHRLNASPRHGDWMTTRLPDGDSVRSWVVYPERSDAAPVLVIVHEIYGLTNWIRAVADQAAADGYIAVAPDLLTMEDVPSGEDGDPDRQAAVAAIRALDEDRVHRDIRAVADDAMALDAARDLYAITGFCWGGSAAFEHATRHDDILAAVVWYGSSPDSAGLRRVSVPVQGHYGGDDARVNATIPRAREIAGRWFSANLYDGAGHGFLRQQDGRDGANLEASLRAWPSMMGFLYGARVAREQR